MDIVIDDVMTVSPICLNPETLVHNTIDIKREKNVSLFPVIDADKKLLGTIRLMDVTRSGLLGN